MAFLDMSLFKDQLIRCHDIVAYLKYWYFINIAKASENKKFIYWRDTKPSLQYIPFVCRLIVTGAIFYSANYS